VPACWIVLMKGNDESDEISIVTTCQSCYLDSHFLVVLAAIENS
jgi:hypothetical protein